jgi:hypothetical protein
VRGEDPAVTAHRRGQHEIGEADEPGVVLDDGCLCPFDIGPGAFVHGHGLKQPFAKWVIWQLCMRLFMRFSWVFHAFSHAFQRLIPGAVTRSSPRWSRG